PTLSSFPYTTLFRSDHVQYQFLRGAGLHPGGTRYEFRPHYHFHRIPGGLCYGTSLVAYDTARFQTVPVRFLQPADNVWCCSRGRSEEHTSELQSREN